MSMKKALLSIYLLTQVNAAFDFFEGFRDSSRRWVPSSKAVENCQPVIDWIEENKYELSNVQQLELDHGKHFSGTGVADVGLYAKHNEAIYLHYHEFADSSTDLDTAEKLTLGFKFKFDNYDTIDCTELRVELF